MYKTGHPARQKPTLASSLPMLLSSIVAVVGITNETRSKQQTGDSQLAPVTPCACVAKCISDIPVPVLQ